LSILFSFQSAWKKWAFHAFWTPGYRYKGLLIYVAENRFWKADEYDTDYVAITARKPRDYVRITPTQSGVFSSKN